MKDRLRYFMAKEGLTAIRLAEIIGVQSSSISHILSGRNKPSFDFIESFMECFPNIDPDWLILGKGDLYRIDGDRGIFDKGKEDKESLFTNITESNNQDIISNGSFILGSEHDHKNTYNESVSNVIEIDNSNITKVINSDVTPVISQNNEIQPYEGNIKITTVITLYGDGTFKEFTKV